MRPSIETTGAQDAIDSLWARAETILGAGRGEVQTSIRKKQKGEQRKPPHGAAIWNFLKVGGADPGAYASEEISEVCSFIEAELTEILAECGRTHRPQVDRAQRLLRAAAEELAEWAQRNIKDGGLGQNTGRYAKRKKEMTYAGLFPSDHGIPGPKGYRTGRFANGIIGGWKLGGRRKHAKRWIADRT